MYEGVVRWFNNAKGYGFLGREGANDVFCHYSAIQGEGYKTLKEGEAVSFNVIQGEKGPQADHVCRASDKQAQLPQAPLRQEPPLEQAAT